MNQHRPFQVIRLAQGFHQLGQIMAVHRPHILKAQFLEQHTVDQQILEGVLQLFHGFGYLAADGRDFFQKIFHVVLGLQVMPVRADFA
ncbi:hypothetical protein D3C81_2024890 [compost metagenome]